MKVLLLYLFTSFSVYGQIQKVKIETSDISSDTLINGKKIIKMRSVQKNAINDFTIINSVFDTDKRHLEVRDGKEWIMSVMLPCQPGEIAGSENDCGIGGGSGFTPPVLSANIN
jgi:hypothetical protein